MSPRRSRVLSSLLLSVLGVSSCAPTTATYTASPGVRSTENEPVSAAAIRSSDVAVIGVTRESWSFRGYEGEIIRTPHYRIFTTDQNQVMKDRLTALVEESMRRYRTFVADLPEPPMRLDTYLMQNRPQWEQVTRLLLSRHADTIVRIERGGFATRGVAVYFNIGLADTMSIAAHEGWHQYTQRTFRSRLPVWLEEAMAVYHEGHRWEGSRPVFLPWSNPERYDRLREAVSADRFIPFSKLITMTPNDHLEGNSPTILDFYAHVWAASHFLMESPNLRPSLAQILEDAASGQLKGGHAGSWRSMQHRSTSTGERSAPAMLDPILVYSSLTPESLDARYEAFVREIVRPGGRDRMISGHSPLRPMDR